MWRVHVDQRLSGARSKRDPGPLLEYVTTTGCTDCRDIRLLGNETVDGGSTRIIAFVRPDLPVWFRVWVGVDDGLVRRMEMRAEGHLMDHVYSDFDGPISIEPPR